MHNKVLTPRALTVALAALLCAGACRQDMHDQPKYKGLRGSAFFADKRSARPVLPDTVARGQLREDSHFYAGKTGNDLAATFPMSVTRSLLSRGRERYDIFCSPCHDRIGTGWGMVVRRGFKRPASFHEERLRNSPPGYFFDAMTNGFGAMSDYAAQIEPSDRWAIAAYIRALQLSQDARIEDVPEAERGRISTPAFAPPAARLPPPASALPTQEAR